MNYFTHLVMLVCFSGLTGIATAQKVPDLPPMGNASHLSLSGCDWHIHEVAEGRGAERRIFETDPSPPNWIPATVPGNIQSDLEAAQRLKPITYGVFDPRLQRVANKDWWYRKNFTIPASWSGRRLTLVFDGVDCECDIFFNGRRIGSNTCMHNRFQFDVTSAAKTGKINRLAVRLAKRPVGKAGKGGLAGINFRHIWTLGIWKDVRLEATGSARIDWTRVQTSLNGEFTKATISASLEIDSADDRLARAEFTLRGRGARPVAVDAALTQGANFVQAALTVDRPSLWWPNGQGDHPLYVLHSVLRDVNGTVLDERDTRFGIRDIRWEHTEGAPANFISRYLMILNGRPIRTMGSNLVPTDRFMGRMGPRNLNLIRRAKAAGMNTLRIWGGGVALHKEAYDLADELGIMLLQELPMANCVPPANKTFLAELEATAWNIIRQTRNHPSVIEYNGGNEMGWKSDTKHPALQLLQQIMREDAGQLFRATCPDRGATHGPWAYDPWGDDLCFYQKRQTMRSGEYGPVGGATSLEVLQRVPSLNPYIRPTERRTRDLKGETWRRKDLIEFLFGELDDLPLLVKAGQYNAAEGIRYSTDALRRKGKRTGGLTSWQFNAGSVGGTACWLVDYEGRTVLSFDFMKQALAPVSLSLRHESMFFAAGSGIDAELFLTSDAPEARKDLRWCWLARDRRGAIFARKEGTISIAPLEVKSLGFLKAVPPPQTACGPLFVELSLDGPDGKRLTERLHIFGQEAVLGPLRGLLLQGEADADDDKSQLASATLLPARLAQVFFRGNKPGKLTLDVIPPCLPEGVIVDGWIGFAPKSWVQVDLGSESRVGQFRLGRDRLSPATDSGIETLKIETSLNGSTWQTVYDRSGIKALVGEKAGRTLIVKILPVKARFVKATIKPSDVGAVGIGIDEFEIYAPAETVGTPLPHLSPARWPAFSRPVRRTRLETKALPPRAESYQDVLELVVRNTGSMTALFCEPHPLIEYRTDLFIDNNHCFIPPGESRKITIRADREAAGGLSLSQTGWRVSCWNAADVVVEPGGDVLLAVGRRDKMCREFLGYFPQDRSKEVKQAMLNGTRPDPSSLHYLLEGKKTARFEFPLNITQAGRGARLRIHAADQSHNTPLHVKVAINGHAMKSVIPRGLGIQKADPAHLAFPATLQFAIQPAYMKLGKNILEIRVENDGWFTWDSMEIIQ